MADTGSAQSNPKREALRDALSRTFGANIFTNRYTLHPAQVADLVEHLVTSFTLFRTNHDETQVVDLGGELARRGLGIRTLMASIAELQRSEPATPDGETFARALAEGFVSTFESEILSEQEQVRRALTSTLEAQRRELVVKNQAIDSSINGILFADTEGKITFVNHSFLAMWGYSSARQVTGKRVHDVWADNEAGSLVERLMRVGGWRGEVPAKRVDGHAITVSLSASSIRNADGAPIGIMASFVDITESKRLEFEMQQVQKMDDLGQLASGIVHDFNNLLAAIGGYLQLVLLETPSTGQTYRDLLQIKSAVDRGAGLTKQLGYFTRQTSGKREIVDLNEVATETYELLKHTFPRNIDVHLETSANLWTVEADPNQMSQVIMNLCVNARDAVVEKDGRDETGTIGRVTIHTDNVELTELEARQYVKVEAGKYVALRVVDTGTGINRDMQKRLFVPFVTTKKETSGTGLGLAVVYGIVHSHRGFIDVASTEGVGTSICVYIPMAESSPQRETSVQPSSRLVHGKGTLLVVDDDPSVRDVIVRALSVSGYTVFQAASGHAALERYREREGKIDLVILDMVMPEMDGEETLSHLRKIDPGVSALFITGYTSDDRLMRLAQAGQAEVLEKPVDLRYLSERVNALTSRA